MAADAADALPDTVDKELRTRYRQLRVMLHTAGLAATYAFIASKAGDGDGAKLQLAYRAAAEKIRVQLCGAGLLTGDPVQLDVRDVIRQLGAMDPVHYARASAQAEAFTGWLSRLADASWQEAGGGA
jgi:CRISPR/Cas system CMR-associated protein Cmr5 small subunit